MVTTQLGGNAPQTKGNFAQEYVESMEEFTGRTVFSQPVRSTPFDDIETVKVPIRMQLNAGANELPLETTRRAAESSEASFAKEIVDMNGFSRRFPGDMPATNDIGISKMAVSTPSMIVSSDVLEDHLKFDRGKVQKGLMINQIILPGMSESNVTFVADGIYKLVKNIADDAKAMEQLKNEPIRSIYYATESNPDRSRPEIEPSLLLVYSKLLEEDQRRYKPIVDMLKKASVTPITFACVGGVLALHDAVMRVRDSVQGNLPESSLVVTADTAVYDGNRAKNAEATQGAASVSMWVTRQPNMVRVMGNSGMGSFHETLSDFTKFGEDTPKVYGVFSEMVYVYTVAKALEQMEERYSGHNGGFSLKEFDFFLAHVPFPKQAIYFSNFLFSHYLTNYDKALYEEMQKRQEVGPEPGNGRKLTDLIEAKLENFNSNSDKNEWNIVEEIEQDSDIKASWKWIKALGKQPEFRQFIDRFHLNESLRLPSQIGNSYASSIFVGMASLLSHFDYQEQLRSRKGIMVGYGSGAQSMAYTFEVVAQDDPKGRDLLIDHQNGMTSLDMNQYRALHEILIKGDAERTLDNHYRENVYSESTSDGSMHIEHEETHYEKAPLDLLDADRKFLGREKLSEGFHVMLRKDDGTGRYAYVDKEGNAKELQIRH